MWIKRPNTKTLTIRLRQLETRLQYLIEGSAARFFPGANGGQNLAARLVEAMRQGIRTDSTGQPYGPNLFILQAHPSQAASLGEDPVLVDGLTRLLQEEGSEAGLSFASPLAVRIAADPQVPTGEIRIQALHSQVGLTGTTALETNQADEPSQPVLPINAYFIVDGTQVYMIHQPVINIGRRPDNQLVIDDPRVSRVHAQVRAVNGQFMIFDLDSMGGTWVNGERIRQKVLQSGDVVQLSGVPLVFGQEAVLSDSTQEMPPGA